MPGDSIPFSFVNSPLAVTCRRLSRKARPQAACTVAPRSSSYLVWPSWTLDLKPVKVLSVTKLTTPPTASEPYDAEAPPVTTSTRLTKSCGNWLTSVTPVTLAPTTRWPSSSVRVRIVPRPRRLRELRPWMPLLVLLVLVVRPVLPCSAGSSVSVLNRFGLAAFSRSAALRLVVGVGWEKPRAAMREPEMRTTDVEAGSAAVGVASGAVASGVVSMAGSVCACWAWAAAPTIQQALATARLMRVR